MSAEYKNSILLTSVGSLVGRSVVSCLNDIHPSFQLIGTNSTHDEPWLQKLDAIYLVPKTSGNESIFIEKVISLINQYKPIMIIPCRDEDVFLLSVIAEKYPNLRSIILSGSSRMSGVILDKFESYIFSKENDLPFAESSLSIDKTSTAELIKKYGFPLIVKPRKGFGSRQVTFVFDKTQLKTFSLNNNMIIQEYIGESQEIISFMKNVRNNGVPLFYSLEVEKISIQTYININGTINDIFSTRHIMKNGLSIIADRYTQNNVIEIGQKSAECFSRNGWRGPLNIQCIKDSFGRLKIHEFNGRFTGATFFRLALGYDELLHALKDITNISVSRSKYQKVDRAFRNETNLPIDPLFIRNMSVDGFWIKKKLN